jgi:hypothetical protein
MSFYFVNANPQFEPRFGKAVGYFDNDPDVNVAKEIGKFYQTKKQWDIAVAITSLQKKNSEVDIETNLLLLQRTLKPGV